MRYPYAIAELERSAAIADGNAVVNDANGDKTQAALERAVAADCREAVRKLQD
jgi:hypothetical protein